MSVGIVIVEFRNVYKEFRCWFSMNGKRVLVIGLLGLFMISMLAGVVSADSVWDDVKDLFSSGDEDSTMGANFAKILLIALVAMIIYSIAGAIPFIPDNELVRWSISIIVAVLSFLFISVADVRYVLINYQALGIALTTFVPLIIIIVFTWEFRTKKPEIAGPVNKLILTLFVIYAGWTWLTLDLGKDTTSALKWIYPITILAALAWMFLETRIFFKVFKAKLKGESEESNLDKINDWNSQIQRLQDQQKTAKGETFDRNAGQIKDLIEKVKNAEQQ